MKAVILVAGKGLRMEPLTVTTPKCLLPVLNKPILMWQLEALQGLVSEIILVIRNPQTDQTQRAIVEYVDNLQLPFQFTWVITHEALGTGDALWQCRQHLEDQDRFFVLYGDDIYVAEDLQSLFQHPFAILGQEVNDPEKWGILQVDASGHLRQIIEKPTEFVGNLANCGAYILGNQLFQYNLRKSIRGEFELTDLVSDFARDQKMQVVPATKWLPVGYPWHLLTASSQLLDRLNFEIQGTVEPNVVIKGRVKLGPGSIIKSGTYIEGDVVIGANCTIGPNAYLRQMVVVGDNCRLGFGVEVKNSIIMDSSKLDHTAYLPDSILGRAVGYSWGSVTADLRHDGQNVKTMIKGQLVDTGLRKFGTVIGDQVKLGVKTIIYPGRKIWPFQTTLPGQVVSRDLPETATS